ncbi:MAG TPA: ABC transporter permease [Gemmatimonadaceae bacterium]|jgi:putative ABC transport system permease protein|nr:ABC transporter permease [Gemmatimonadaceae bacterium]
MAADTGDVNRRRSVKEQVLRAASDMRYGVRQLRRNASLTTAAMLCLTLGVGANTAIFSVVNAVLYRPLPFRDPENLVLVGEGLPRFAKQNFGVISLPEYADFARLDGHTFAGSAVYEPAAYSVAGSGGDPERVNALRASIALMGVLGVAPARGRDFTASDADTSSASVAIISDALWRRRFNADPTIVGRRVDIEARPVTIVGVMPPSFQFPIPGAGGEPADVFVPIRFTAALSQLRGNSYQAWFVARLARGVTQQAAAHAVNGVATSLHTLHPDAYPNDWNAVADAFPLRGYAVKDVRRPLMILLVAVALVLLMACINVSSLLMARAASRDREIAVRQALGASFGRLVQQFLAESVVLVAGGVAAGVALAATLTRLLAARMPTDVLHGYTVALDVRVLGVTAATAVATTIAFSLVPAIGHRDGAYAERLHDSARSTSGAARQRGRRALVVTQIALALLLTTAAGLMIRSFVRVREVDPGFDAQRLVTFRVGVPPARYAGRMSVLAFEQTLIDALQRLPGVRAVSATNNLPLGVTSRVAFSVQGQAAPTVPLASSEIVYPEYFAAMGIHVHDGRAFSSDDGDRARPVAIVNQTLARRYFGDRSAVGHRVKWGSPGSTDPWLTIVGVTTDVKQLGIDQPADPEIYFPALQQDSNAVASFLRAPAFVVRTDGDPRALLSAIGRVVRNADPELPIVELQPMANVVDASIGARSFNTMLLASFALLALALASVGIYGLIAHSVVQRTREIGIRVAVGADRVDVIRLVVAQGVRLAGIGVTVGLGGALLATRAMRSLLFGITPFDVPTFAAAAIVLFVVALAAGYVPARRAARIDPQSALRAE